MKKIALTQRLIENDNYLEIRETLDINWAKLLSYAGFIPVVLPFEYDFKKLSFDGLIFTGGNDLSSISGSEIDKKRDMFEKEILAHCIANSIPVFGICRGMQLINEYFGGTLKRVKNHVACRHLLDIGNEVNSYHNFGIDKPGQGLLVEAKSNDGTIEIIRHDKYKIYAQMSHPEREIPFKEYEVTFLQDFFND